MLEWGDKAKARGCGEVGEGVVEKGIGDGDSDGGGGALRGASPGWGWYVFVGAPQGSGQSPEGVAGFCSIFFWLPLS